VAVPLAGRGSLDRLLDGFSLAHAVVGVGPARATARPVVWCREEPPRSGPLAAVAAALPFTAASVVVVAGGDMPLLAGAEQRLLVALDAGSVGAAERDAAVLVDASGVRQPLAAAYRRTSLVRRLEEIGRLEDKPIRLLLDGMDVVEVDAAGATIDLDTWDDVERITKELRRAR
jgi:molybdopterin-guanine dinucleotide biosynthesis protein A